MDIINSFELYLRDQAKDQQTIKAYKQIAINYYDWVGGEEKILKAKPVDIKEYTAYLRHEKLLSAVTVNKYLAAIKSLYSYIEENGQLLLNPTTRIKSIIVSNNFGDSNKWLSPKEQDRFIAYADLERNEWLRIRNLAVIDLMLYAGLRVQEVSDLLVADIAPEDNHINITVRDGKRGKYAVVKLVHKYSRNLKKWLNLRKQADKPVHVQSANLFVSERSEQLHVRSIHKFIKKYGDLAGMSFVSPHCFRHSFCKNLAREGTPIEIVRRLARHEKIETTAIYIEPSGEELIGALNKM
ncbi:tyrosine-type recombinase/integrase [Sporosarcina sp. FSL W7-1283]|uniref:tyrosine-type recombinase/integrase n=1 Tax=Sporosarcina sp. FSL W7-1283 TaxID=2921560 RepID=UPI0030F4F010